MTRLLVFTCLIALVACSEPMLQPHHIQLNVDPMKRMYEGLNGRYKGSTHINDNPLGFPTSIKLAAVWDTEERIFWVHQTSQLDPASKAPERVRMARIEQLEDSVFRWDWFRVPRWAELLSVEDFFRQWSPDSLQHLTDCEVYLILQKSGSFKGHTKGRGCSLTDSDSTYVTQMFALDGLHWQQTITTFTSEDEVVKTESIRTQRTQPTP